MFKEFFNFNKKKEKKEKPFLKVANYNVFLKERNIKSNDSEIKSLLDKVINSPEFYIENSEGKKLVGQEFDAAREIIWRNLGHDNSEMKKIEEALNQNRLSYNRSSQLSLILDLAKEQSIEVEDLKVRLRTLISNIDNKKYSELSIDKKEEFMVEIDKIATELYNRI